MPAKESVCYSSESPHTMFNLATPLNNSPYVLHTVMVMVWGRTAAGHVQFPQKKMWKCCLSKITLNLHFCNKQFSYFNDLAATRY